MPRTLPAAFVLAAATWATPPLSADEPKILTSASDSEPTLVRLKKNDSGIAIRSAKDLAAIASLPGPGRGEAPKDLEAELAKRFQLTSIDWNKQMVLVTQGRPTRGEHGTIKFEPLKIDGKTLVVHWHQENRSFRAPYQGPPIGFALVDRFEGDVSFIPREFANSIEMTLVLIPRGKFLMGSPKDEENRLDEELQHEVEITRPYYMGKHEVTVGQFKAFVKDTNYQTEAEKDGKGGRAFDGKEFIYKPEFTWKNLYYKQADYEPVVVVTWNDAVAFCAWLSKKEGVKYRLPTEAEWEYACRAGTQTRFHTGDRDDDLKLAGNIADASLKKKWPDAFWCMTWDDRFPFTAPVGYFKMNAFGLNDMHGNAWEWCSDWYAEDYYSKSPKQDPQGPATGKERVARGGAWSTQPKFCRSAFRDWHEPGYRSDCVGFRVVAEIAK
ncbi:MAG TPA: formylglycine-generating enzyme family protein [Gemmataceae bacterium]|jgi:formylglycine-generating enzyme required for sulfatase activity|nr:formylglycine-generating enzyme family protein [Gemmataceae bacterium]